MVNSASIEGIAEIISPDLNSIYLMKSKKPPRREFILFESQDRWNKFPMAIKYFFCLLLIDLEMKFSCLKIGILFDFKCSSISETSGWCWQTWQKNYTDCFKAITESDIMHTKTL